VNNPSRTDYTLEQALQWTQYLGGGRASSRVHKGRECTRKVCPNSSLQGVMIGSSNNCKSEKSPKVRRRLLLFLLNSRTVNSVKFAFLTLVFPPMLLEHAYLVAWMFSPDCRLCVSGISITALQLIANCNLFCRLFWLWASTAEWSVCDPAKMFRTSKLSYSLFSDPCHNH
jgi:hypothetical protein